MTELDRVYDKYKRTVNMSYSELLRWSKTQCSRKASLDRSPIRRNLRLLKKPKSLWDKRDIKDANKTIYFVARMKKVKAGKPVCNGLSRRSLALRNWAFDPKK